MILKLKIQLDGATKPPIWREVEVADTAHLGNLHYIIQAAMGWDCSHLHHFFNNSGDYYGEISEFSDDDVTDELTVQIKTLLTKKGDKLKYEYDFGDSWLHTISVLELKEAEKGVKYPRLLAGKGACPPEDCGGVWGYADLKEIMKNPEHEDYEEMSEWLSDDFDPNEFDLEEHQKVVNKLAK